MDKKIRILLFLASILILCALVACGPATSTPTPTATQVPLSTPESLSVAVDEGQAQTGPRIVAQNPLEGERLNLSPVIELTFDRDMNQSAAAAAWTFTSPDGAAVPGTVTWKDARTFQFKPDIRLAQDTKYRGIFSTSAVDGNGTAPSAEIDLKFQTVVGLAVGQTFPTDGATDIETSTSITVVFNRPVVPLVIAEEQNTLPQPLMFTPPVAGKGQWVNSSMYIFQPDARLNSWTTYTVRIAAGLADTTGNALESDVTWQFTTVAVNGYISGSNFDNVPLDRAINIIFNQPMDTASVQKAVSVVNRETGAAVPFQVIWSKSATQFTVKPAGLYQLASFYRLVVADTAFAVDGGRLTKQLIVDFSTLPLPRITNVYPADGSKIDKYVPYFQVFFASPMNSETLKDKFTVSPQPEGKLDWYYSSYDRTLTVYGLGPSTDYIVRILPGMADIYGNTISTGYSFSFRTGNLPSYANLLTSGGPLIYRENGAQEMFFEYTNLDSAEIDLYSISFDEFAGLTNQVGKAQDWNDFQPQAEPLRQWTPDVPGMTNRLVRIRLNLKGESNTPLPPGYYFIGLKASPLDYSTHFLQGNMFIVATDNLTLKASPSEALAWLVDLESGKPTAGVPVVFYDLDFNEVGRVVTDADGLAFLPGVKDVRYARTDDSQRMAYISSFWGSGVSTGQFGLWWNYYNEYSTRFAYVYTDRPLYRPGQDVYFTGFVRTNDDLHYSLPFQRSVYVTILREGEQIYARDLTLDDQGVFTDTIHLDDNATLGSYDINVFSSRYTDAAFSSVSFRVAEYHKPEFQVLASPNASDVLVGDQVTVDVDASYYSGGNVGNAAVYWYTESSPYNFYPGGKYARYSFADWDRDTYWSNPQTRTASVMSEGNAVADENGHLTVTQTASLGKSKTSRQLQFYADVTDVAGNLVGVHTSLVVHQSQWYAGIRSEHYIGEVGQEQSFGLVVLDWQANPVPGQTVSVDIVERQWYSVQQTDKNGVSQWVTSVKDVPAAHFDAVTTDQNGMASVSFTPAAGGIYKATVTVRDLKGNTHQASTFQWISGGDYIPWKQTNDRSFELVTDQDSYQPGDTAEILIAQPFKGTNYAILTIERGHIYHYEVIRLDSNSTIYKLPITSEMAPAAYVSVVVVSGAGNAGTPNFKLAISKLNVDTNLQTLAVSISTDKAVAGPGDEVTYTIQTRDPAGKPVSAEVSLALVDKAILALAPSNSPAILDAFYPVRALNVTTSLGIVLNADDFNANYTETPPEGRAAGGGGEGKGSGDEGIVAVRENFRDTAFFQAQVKTDSNGLARVTVTLPENLTTWVMDVRAATADSLVGQATHELLSTKPLFIQLQTPRFFVAGDQARIGATIFNNGTEPLDVSVFLDVKGLELLTSAGRNITVKGGQQAYVTWDVNVTPGAERVDLIARATSGPYTDASTPPLGTLDGNGIPVYRYHVIETVGTSGLISQADSITEAVQLPTTISLDDSTLHVSIAPSLAASVQDGLTFLQDYPYSCMEQTSSGLRSNVLSLRILKLSGKTDAALESRLNVQIGTALQRIYASQNSDGGWGWWSYESDMLTSVYVVLALAEARDAGVTVSDAVLNNSLDYLNVNSLSLQDGDPTWRYNREAFRVYVVTRAGSPDSGSAAVLYEHRDRLSLYGEAFLARAMALQNPDDSRVQDLLSDIGSASIMSAAGIHWEEADSDYWNWGTDRRTTAIVLSALVQIDPSNAITANAVRWLVASRSAGEWGTTQEAAWSMEALANWLEASHEFETSYHYVVGLNGKLLQEGDANPDNLTQTVDLQIGVAQMLREQANYLVVARGEGTGNLYYTAYLDATLPVPEVKALDRGIIVSRQYFRLTDDKTPVTQVARGELLQVRITVIAPSALYYVLVNDPLPGGLEAVDSTLETSAQVPSVYTAHDFSKFGWGWWLFDHIEMHDEKVVLSADYLPAGTYVYNYLARASTAGTFNVIPVTAEEFYFPDVSGRGDGSVFVVTP